MTTFRRGAGPAQAGREVGVRGVGGVEPGALLARYEGLVCDLDGVVYTGERPVLGAVATINRALDAGRSIVFATNNASREPAVVAAQLRGLGVDGARWSVATSAQAAADVVAADLGPGGRVVTVGGPGVAAAVREAGLVAVRVDEVGADPVGAIVQGLGVEVSWRELAEVGFLVRAGVPWVATNLDMVLPLDRGPAPGNGALVGVVSAAAGVWPRVVGKPERGLYELALKRLGTVPASTLVCGDRLDTDIAGARVAGLDSVVVLSGITRLRDVVFAPAAQRPDYVAACLRGLLAPVSRLVPDRLARPWAGSTWLPDPGPDCDAQHRLESLVRAGWGVLDAGGHLPADDRTWLDLERELL